MRVSLRALLRHTLAGVRRPDQVLVLGPHDSLVLVYDATITSAEADRAKARIRADFPGTPVSVVCVDGARVKTGVRG